jgi:hypothetical protein
MAINRHPELVGAVLDELCEPAEPRRVVPWSGWIRESVGTTAAIGLSLTLAACSSSDSTGSDAAGGGEAGALGVSSAGAESSGGSEPGESGGASAGGAGVGGSALGSGGQATGGGQGIGGSGTGGSGIGGNIGSGGSGTGGNVGSGGSGTGGGGIGAAGGAPDSGAGGTAGPWDAWPDWVPACVGMRAQLCSLCAYPECVMCVYGTDEEIEQTGVVCDDTEENYRLYCTGCDAGGSCPPCREEWRG